jgi:membrane protease YdiL (CAAX protease family)
MGLVTVLLAFLLGLVTGYLRAQSRSLLPAIIVHAMFNIAGSIGSFI